MKAPSDYHDERQRRNVQAILVAAALMMLFALCFPPGLVARPRRQSSLSLSFTTGHPRRWPSRRHRRWGYRRDGRHHRHCSCSGLTALSMRRRRDRSFSYQYWCLHCLLRRWGHWEDTCPRCRRSSLFIRNERLYCPRCYLSFRLRRCRKCDAFVVVAVPAYEDGPRRRGRDSLRHYRRQSPSPPGDEKETERYLRWMDLGRAELQGQRYQLAARSFRAALRERPDDAVCQFYWALALAAHGELERGGTIVIDALDGHPSLAQMPLSGAALFGGESVFRELMARLRPQAMSSGSSAKARFMFAMLLNMSEHTRREGAALFSSIKNKIPAAAYFQ